MFVCPNCQGELRRAEARPGVFWVCPSCGGRSSTVALLRSTVEHGAVSALWQGAHAPGRPRSRACPACRATMAEVQLKAGAETKAIDVCTACQFVWFDAHEYDAMPETVRELTPLEALPPEARERYARLAVAAIQASADGRAKGGAPDVEIALDDFASLFDGDLDEEALAPVGKPWLTRLLVATVALATIGAGVSKLTDVEAGYRWFSLAREDVVRLWGLPLLTSFFRQGSILELVVNVFVLYQLGAAVERLMGRERLVLVLALSAAAGSLAHVLAVPVSYAAGFGASGGLTGLVVYFACSEPRARLGLPMFLGRKIVRVMNVSARVMCGLWFFLQVLLHGVEPAGKGHVSWAMYVGGAVAGALLWAKDRRGEQSFL